MGRKAIEITTALEGEWVRVLVNGPLDEDARAALTNVTPLLGEKVILDLAGVTQINSVGVRDWSLFLRNLRSSREVVFEHCADEVVRTMSMVINFHARLPVRSLYRTYGCPHCNHEQTHLLVEGQDYRRGEIPQPRPQICARCGEETCGFEQDEEFFQFLLSA